MPMTTQSIQTLRNMEGLAHDMMRDLENVMRDADYLGDDNVKKFNTAGKLRNLAQNVLNRIVDVQKDIKNLEFNDVVTFDEFVGKKKTYMNECKSIVAAVETQWAEVQKFLYPNELEVAYDQVIASNEVNEHLEQS